MHSITHWFRDDGESFGHNYLPYPADKAPYLVFSVYTVVAIGSCIYTDTLLTMDDVGKQFVYFNLRMLNEYIENYIF